jgi:hypothetical protein
MQIHHDTDLVAVLVIGRAIKEKRSACVQLDGASGLAIIRSLKETLAS